MIVSDAMRSAAQLKLLSIFHAAIISSRERTDHPDPNAVVSLVPAPCKTPLIPKSRALESFVPSGGGVPMHCMCASRARPFNITSRVDTGTPFRSRYQASCLEIVGDEPDDEISSPRAYCPKAARN
jgi:hypothetical protein